MIDAFRHRIAHHVGSNKEIRGEAHLFDDAEFLIDAPVRLLVTLAVTVTHAFERHLAQQLHVVVNAFRETFFVFRRFKVKIYTTLIYNSFRCLYHLRKESIGSLQFLGWNQHLICGSVVLKPRNQDVFVDGSEVFMHLKRLLVKKSHRLRYHQLILMIPQIRHQQPRHLRQAHSDKFIISKL